MAAPSGAPVTDAPTVDAAIRVVDDNGIRIRDVTYMFFARLVDSASSHNNTLAAGAAAALPTTDDERSFYLPQLKRVSEDTQWSTVVVKWGHFTAYDSAASSLVESSLARYEESINEGLAQVLRQFYGEHYSRRVACYPQLVFCDVPRCFTVRTLRALCVGELCSLAGTVTRTSQVRPELLVGVFRCSDCGTDSDPIPQQFRYTEPLACRNPACENRAHWTLNMDSKRTRFGDWQKLRVQENAHQIPVGCMPRTIEVVVRNDAVEAAKPGDRVVLSGYAIVVPEVAKLFNALNRREVQRALTGGQRAMMEDEQLHNLEGITGLKALGVRDLNYRLCFLATTVADSDGDLRKMTQAVKESADEIAAQDVTRQTTDAEIERIQQMRRCGNILRSLTRCVAPNIFRHDLVKTGLLLQLIGGVAKRTVEMIDLRGDINVCIIGDPSTAKSQFLKWVAANVSRGVFTSGKSSSASGLTATVNSPDGPTFNAEPATCTRCVNS